jgi:hypothetical protein
VCVLRNGGARHPYILYDSDRISLMLNPCICPRKSKSIAQLRCAAFGVADEGSHDDTRFSCNCGESRRSGTFRADRWSKRRGQRHFDRGHASRI